MGILIAYLLGLLTAIKPKDDNRARDHRSADSHERQSFQGPISVICVPRTLSDQEQTEKGKKERHKTISFWVRIATLLIFVIYAGFTILIWRANKKAAETAAKELELSQRPWISLENFSVDGPLIFDSNGAHINISYEIKNTGHSPAIRGFWQQELFLQFTEVPSPVKKRDDACKIAAYRSTKVTDPRISETWFPGDSLPRPFEESFSRSDIAKALEIPKSVFPGAQVLEESGYLYPEIVVCVAYRAAFTDTQYHTGYILKVGRINPKMPYIPPLKSGEIPASELKLYIHPFYGIYAD